MASGAKSNEWWRAPPVVQNLHGVLVVRDDLLLGGSKIRFLPYVVGDAHELVFGGPFCGGAPYALSVWGHMTGVRVTLFYAKRKNLHWRQKAAFRNGATIYQVPAGRIAVVQHRARNYAASVGARFLPLGFDVPNATEPYEAVMRGVAERHPEVREVWCATGSGMLARCLARAFPQAQVYGVAVGLASRNEHQAYPANTTILRAPQEFADEGPPAPFPACRNYESKAWAIMQGYPPSGPRLFWNVMGDKEPTP